MAGMENIVSNGISDISGQGKKQRGPVFLLDNPDYIPRPVYIGKLQLR